MPLDAVRASTAEAESVNERSGGDCPSLRSVNFNPTDGPLHSGRRFHDSPGAAETEKKQGQIVDLHWPVLSAEVGGEEARLGKSVNQRAASSVCVPMSMMDQPPEVSRWSRHSLGNAGYWVCQLARTKATLPTPPSRMCSRNSAGQDEIVPGIRPRAGDPPTPQDVPAQSAAAPVVARGFSARTCLPCVSAEAMCGSWR